MNMASLVEASKGFGGVWQFIFSVLGVVIASSIVIEISPIKINPVKTAVGWISKSFKGWFEDVIDSSLDKQLSGIKEEDKKRDEAIVKMDSALEDITKKVDQITDRIDQNEERAQANHIAAVRRSILTFGNQLRGGMDASKESFDDILEQYDEYREYVREKEISNGRMDLTISMIRDMYSQKFNHMPDES